MIHESKQTFDEKGNWTLPDLTKEQINAMHENYNYFQQASIQRNHLTLEEIEDGINNANRKK